MKKTISVILPVYNEERTISSLIEIIRTWGKASEIIVVNDGSTDKTLSAISRFSRQITIISREKNYGKGFSMAQGVRRSSGDLIMFMDGDVVGLTHRDLDSMVNPVLHGHVDMVIAVTNCSTIGPVAPFDAINGERVLKRNAIIDHLRRFHHVGNGVEFIINDLHKHKKVKTIYLRHVYILSKVEKAPIPDAMLGYVKEAGQFLRAIAQIQTHDLSPQVRKMFKTTQAYIQKALDYF